MAIEVLLKRSVETLGKVGEVVRVRPGYARNFLYPHGIAVPPTAENLRLVEKDKAAEAVIEAERAKVLAALAEKITTLGSVTVEAKANPEGHLFGSVGPKQVVDAAAAKGVTLEERQVRLEPIKELGEYEVTVHLSPEVEPKLKVWVVEELGKDAVPEGQAGPTLKGPMAAKAARDAAKDAKEREKDAAKEAAKKEGKAAR
jgi:large subunit ribosomal protein L9